MVKPKRLLGLLLRLIAFGATLAAVIIMATSREKGSFFALSYEAKYSDTPAFKYFVIANAIVTVYGFLALFVPSESPLWRLVLALDLVFTMLLISSISAALAVAQVGKKGNSSAGWLPVCGQVTKYCNQVTGALVAGYQVLGFSS
ncbi:CASP-like protein 1C3 isoform X2 [Populus alba]|uniref:CASP-like protein 1C3 isoform X2 n=1 Tax=Populus alba TaxID=43335 RepID=UPI00158AA29E|nr:CASP-like protein 1C3 isoform X2 [Populus alba]XP_034916626.1 CASP-like protein 1C3 isoform X2 [Populus alba]